MNIIAIMGPHGVFYKDEPIKELESALVAQGFQIIWPQNSVDLLKFIEHNPRICGVIFDWDEYSLDLCSDINQLNEYLPLYAFINTHSTMDVSVQDMRMALWFFEYALGQAEDIAIRMRQYTDEYLDNITPPFTKALFTYVKERKYTFLYAGGIWAVPPIKKARLAVCFMIFSAGIPSRLMSLFRLPSLVRCSTTPGHTWKRKSTSRGLLARNRVISLPTEHRRRTKLWVCTPRHPAVRC
ncbi:lysine decarboxylase, constitutive [Escherichia coli]|uniref:Lysine decarboxylase, constitutive n=1 Tax=Escherichia coli TaxID=562 RepID=A0A2X1JMN3_ECOLX|nr:lysine decarboxylase, constitutive [Escherichia coli]